MNGDKVISSELLSMLIGGVIKNNKQSISECFSLDAKNCLDNASSDIYLFKENGQALFFKTWGGSNIPKLYGHAAFLVEIEDGIKVAFIFGGRSPDCSNTVCNKLYKLGLPLGPIELYPNSNKIEEIIGQGDPPIALFGHSMIAQNRVLYLFGGATINDGELELQKTLYIYLPANNTWTKYKEILGFPIEQNTLWDGSLFINTISQGAIPPRFNPLIIVTSSAIQIFGGVTLFRGLLIPLKDKWELIINQLSANVKPKKLDTGLELFSNQIPGLEYCWDIDISRGLWFMQISVTGKSRVVVKDPLSESIYLLPGLLPLSSSDGCSLSESDDRVVAIGVSSSSNKLTFSISKPKDSNSNIIASYYGVNFCKWDTIGQDCTLRCPSSYNANNLDKMSIECSDNGVCINNSCSCDNGFIGGGCESRNCPNNCSNDQISDPALKNICVEAYPENYCSCSFASKRGGDDCSKIFCLNGCGPQGECQQDGHCKCNKKFSGPDCSVHEIEMYLE